MKSGIFPDIKLLGIQGSFRKEKMQVSKANFKSVFEWLFLAVIFIICALAFNGSLVQPSSKFIVVSVFLVGWLVQFIYGVLAKESYSLKASRLTKPIAFI